MYVHMCIVCTCMCVCVPACNHKLFNLLTEPPTGLELANELVNTRHYSILLFTRNITRPILWRFGITKQNLNQISKISHCADRSASTAK